MINEKINKERQEISKKRELVEEIRSILKIMIILENFFRWRLNDYSRYDRLYFSRLDYFWNSCFFNFLIVLNLIFKRFRWVVIPLSTAFFSSIISVGIIGWLNWEVTVVSANFVSIVMIISLSLAVHLIVRYQELNQKLELEQKSLVNETMKQMFIPCLYTALTTIVAFASLVVSDIKPLIDFGLMMVVSICCVFIFTFVYFGALNSLFAKNTFNLKPVSENFTNTIFNWVERRLNTTLTCSSYFHNFYSRI